MTEVTGTTDAKEGRELGTVSEISKQDPPKGLGVSIMRPQIGQWRRTVFVKSMICQSTPTSEGWLFRS